MLSAFISSYLSITSETFLYLCAYPFRVEWMYDYQGMVILACNQVWWTWEVEDVFMKVKRGDKMAMKNYAKKLHSQIDALVVQVRELFNDMFQL